MRMWSPVGSNQTGIPSALLNGGFHVFRLKINSKTSPGAARSLPLPRGNEWRGAAKALDIFGPEHPFYGDEDPEKPLTISCICDGIPCRRCKKNLIHRPISDQWDEHNGFRHNSYLAGLFPCKECAPKRQTFDEIIEDFEKKNPDKAYRGELGKPSSARDGGIALSGGKGTAEVTKTEDAGPQK